MWHCVDLNGELQDMCALPQAKISLLLI